MAQVEVYLYDLDEEMTTIWVPSLKLQIHSTGVVVTRDQPLPSKEMIAAGKEFRSKHGLSSDFPGHGPTSHHEQILMDELMRMMTETRRTSFRTQWIDRERLNTISHLDLMIDRLEEQKRYHLQRLMEEATFGAPVLRTTPEGELFPQ